MFMSVIRWTSRSTGASGKLRDRLRGTTMKGAYTNAEALRQRYQKQNKDYKYELVAIEDGSKIKP